ncbi:MAG: phytoene desaturase family protein [Tepidiformaceae bacterium]
MQLPREVDVAVIGSGFGGLTAGALAAKSGLEVALFEQHTRPGGCAGDFALGGFWFPAGATVITGLEPGGILRQVFDSLGLPVQARELSPALVLHVGGLDLPFSTDLDSWLASLRSQLPGAGRYERFWRWTAEAGGVVYRLGGSLPSLPIESLSDVRRSAKGLRPEVLKTARLIFETVEGVKRRLGATGDRVQDAIIDGMLMDATGAPARECSAIQGAIALDLYRRGCQWVDGGSGALAMKLVRSIRADGGTVSFATAVTDLAREGRRWRVTLNDGRTILAGRVVANLPPDAVARLLGKQGRPTRDRDAWGAFTLHLGIQATGLALENPFHQVIDLASPTGLEDGGNVFVSLFPGRGVRADQWSVSASTHTSAGGWKTKAIGAQRRAMEERMLDAVGCIIPDVRERLVLCGNATPQTYERFTKRPGGYVGGLIQRRSVVALRAPGHRPERGLYLAGDSVFPGQGTVGVALSGINAYRDVVESFGRKPLL